MERHLRLVSLQLRRQRRFRRPDRVGRERADLFQDGCLGLAEAIRRFDPAGPVAFGPFALARIRRAIHDGLCDGGSGVRVPGRTLRRWRARRRAAPRVRADVGQDRRRPERCPAVASGLHADALPAEALEPDSRNRPTIGDLARQRWERLAREVVDEMVRDPRGRPDTAGLIRACLEERWLVAREESRFPLRGLAERFHSGLGRVTHYEQRFRAEFERAIRADPALAWLVKLAGGRRADMFRRMSSEEEAEYRRRFVAEHADGH